MLADDSQTLWLRITLGASDSSATSELAKRVVEMGLEASQISPRGLLVSGPKKRFEDAFRAPIDFKDGTAHFKVEPSFARLPEGHTYRAYFPRAPTYFGGDHAGQHRRSLGAEEP